MKKFFPMFLIIFSILGISFLVWFSYKNSQSQNKNKLVNVELNKEIENNKIDLISLDKTKNYSDEEFLDLVDQKFKSNYVMGKLNDFYKIIVFDQNKTGKFGLIDRNLNVIIEPKYDILEKWGNIFIVGNLDEFRLNSLGSLKDFCINKNDYAYATNFFVSRCFQTTNLERGENLNKKLLISHNFFEFNGKYELFDLSGKKINNESYDNIFFFDNKNSLKAFKKKGLTGFIDKDGKVKIEPQYERAVFFENDEIKVGKDGLIGLINFNGETILPFNNFDFWEFGDQETTCAFNDKGDTGIINREGKVVLIPADDPRSICY